MRKPVINIQKPIVYASIPEFDQITQAVFQSDPIDMGDHIEFGVFVVDLPPQDISWPEELH